MAAGSQDPRQDCISRKIDTSLPFGNRTIIWFKLSWEGGGGPQNTVTLDRVNSFFFFRKTSFCQEVERKMHIGSRAEGASWS